MGETNGETVSGPIENTVGSAMRPGGHDTQARVFKSFPSHVEWNCLRGAGFDVLVVRAWRLTAAFNAQANSLLS